MQITVSGKQLDVGDTLRGRIEDRIAAGVSKYLDRVTDVTVVLSKKAGYLFVADIVVNTGTHDQIGIKASAEGDDAYACFDAAADKVEKQLRRYKRKLTDHHKNNDITKQALADAMYYVIESSDNEVTEDHPLVIAENPKPLPHLTVSQAVMRMDLSDAQTFVFVNNAHGGVNVVYRRPDGNIGWVDPQGSTGQKLQKTG